LVDGAHAHAHGDVRAQAKEGSRGGRGHGGMVAAAANPALGVAVPPQPLSHSAAPGSCSMSARGVVPIALDGDVVQNGAMAAPSTQETSLPQRLQGAREEVLAVAHRYGARNLRIYGSVARGQDRPGSDLDLLVDLERGCSLLDVIALRQELEALLNCQVDLAEAAQLHPLIRDQIIAQAKAL
jgi:uncharacterized protein